jgi:hypothetical protein
MERARPSRSYSSLGHPRYPALRRSHSNVSVRLGDTDTEAGRDAAILFEEAGGGLGNRDGQRQAHGERSRP